MIGTQILIAKKDFSYEWTKHSLCAGALEEEDTGVSGYETKPVKEACFQDSSLETQANSRMLTRKWALKSI